MAASARAVADYFGDRILYINVMNNLSIDCDCDSHPHAPEMKDIGILASLDPVALDQAPAWISFTPSGRPKGMTTDPWWRVLKAAMDGIR